MEKISQLPLRGTRALARFVAGCLLVTVTGVQAQVAGIHVTGAGEVQVVPDLVRVNLQARREGTDAAALKTELDAVTRAVLALTRELGIEPRDVTAAAVDIHPRYRHRDGESVVDGVVATRSISITLRDLDEVGVLINGALARGANGVGNVELDAANRPALERQALELAIDDAMEQGRQIAARIGVGHGPLLNSLSAAPTFLTIMMDLRAAADAPTESFAPGELTIRREISASFAIEPRPADR